MFAQGAPASSVYYIQGGGVMLAVLSSTGKEAIVGLLGPGEFFGEGCLARQDVRMGTATTVLPTVVLRITKGLMLGLVDQLFSSSEKRLAWALLLLARYGREDEAHRVLRADRRPRSPARPGRPPDINP